MRLIRKWMQDYSQFKLALAMARGLCKKNNNHALDSQRRKPITQDITQ